MRRPLVPIGLTLIGGILLGARDNLSSIIFLIVSGTILAATLLLRRRASLSYGGLLALTAVAFGLYGAWSASRIEFPVRDSTSLATYADKGEITITGEIVDGPEAHPDGAIVIVNVRRVDLAAGAYVPVRGRTRVRVEKGGEALRYGDEVRLTARVRTMRAYGNPGAYRIDRYHRMLGVATGAYIRDVGEIEIVRRDGGWFGRRWLESARRGVAEAIAASLPQPQASIVAALTVGEVGGVPDGVRDVFRDAGVAHVLAVSGLHVGMVAAAIFAVVFFVARRFSRLVLSVNVVKLSAAVAIVPVVFYAALAGGRVSSTRAAIMVGVLLVAVILDRHRDLISAVTAAAVAILLVRPTSLFTAGFQLSFVAVYAIALMLPRVVRSRFEGDNPLESVAPTRTERATRIVVAALATPLVAGLATAPITAYHFNGVATYSLFTNVVFIPLYGFLVVPACLAGVVLLPISAPAASACWHVAMYAINAGHYLAAGIATLPGAYLHVAPPLPTQIVGWYAFFLGLLYWPRHKAAKAATAIGVVLLAMTPLITRSMAAPSDSARLTVIDVGQGVAQLLESPDGTRILVDTGGVASESFDVGEQIVAPYLWRRRIERLDLVVISHPDIDHYGGLAFLVDNFAIGEVWLSKAIARTHPADRAIVRYLDAHGVPWRRVGAGESLVTRGALRLRVIQPTDSVPRGGSADNNASLVIRADFGTSGALLAADIESQAEAALVASEAPLAADILVAPHQGSRTSSTPAFVKAVSPDVVVFSVGHNNRHGHPAREVVRRYEEAGARTYRTDRDGQVVCDLKADRWSCAPFRRAGRTDRSDR
ncbi:MAG: DNA internalization-related competence protein ComEC/Rec2 [Deltaproteobacteria bacterium]|nr:DNA internalization-related competence protein ComEC/Rec2 [Deltaproteobacteria bacterium]